ncbi:BQ2448_2183 [Microbotryum intermedium]|uniref:BQ2448_2183 protein n=1 Tax=Microbotryum intermedium TaxID=269621 RepID=A0A238FAX2_9BASI|nr:BQ2448_2183 [Microbotryum intermedium]
MTFEIDHYLAHGEARSVASKQRRIEGYECCICPEFSGKRWSPALALRHFRTIEHRRKARTRRSALLDESQTSDAIVSDAISWEAIDDVRPMGGMLSDSEDEAVRQREQVGKPATEPVEQSCTDNLESNLYERFDVEEVDGDENARHQNDHMDSALGDVAFFDHNRCDDSDEDDEEAKRLDLDSRGIATDPDMVHLEFDFFQTLRKADDPKLHNLWRGLQIVLARSIQSSSTARLDPSVEQRMDQKTMKHFFRPYAKAGVALPRLCRFFKDAQDAVEKVLREERVIKPELEETSKIYRQTAKAALTSSMADARSDYVAQLNKIKDHIEEHPDPIFLMTSYLNNSLVFSDEHIMFWLYNAGGCDPREKFFKAYEDFFADVAGHIATGYQAGGDAYDWRKYVLW